MSVLLLLFRQVESALWETPLTKCFCFWRVLTKKMPTNQAANNRADRLRFQGCHNKYSELRLLFRYRQK